MQDTCPGVVLFHMLSCKDLTRAGGIAQWQDEEHSCSSSRDTNCSVIGCQAFFFQLKSSQHIKIAKLTPKFIIPFRYKLLSCRILFSNTSSFSFVLEKWSVGNILPLGRRNRNHGNTSLEGSPFTTGSNAIKTIDCTAEDQSCNSLCLHITIPLCYHC